MSKNADGFMKESNKLLENKKATSEQHKVSLSVDNWYLLAWLWWYTGNTKYLRSQSVLYPTYYYAVWYRRLITGV